MRGERERERGKERGERKKIKEMEVTSCLRPATGCVCGNFPQWEWVAPQSRPLPIFLSACEKMAAIPEKPGATYIWPPSSSGPDQQWPLPLAPLFFPGGRVSLPFDLAKISVRLNTGMECQQVTGSALAERLRWFSWKGERCRTMCLPSLCPCVKNT